MKTPEEAWPNTVLKEERLLRGWSQKKLAELLGPGVDTQNIRRWELGKTVPAKYYQERLCTIFGKSARELGFITIAQQPPGNTGTDRVDSAQTAEPLSPAVAAPLPSTLQPPSTPSSPIWNVPYRRNPFFTGREDILQYLHDALTFDKTAALMQAYAMNGLGGVGKTLTAVEYAYRYRHEYQAVFWVRADTNELLVADFVNIAGLLDLPEQMDVDQGRVVQAVQHWFNQHSGWLLILDNADDLEIANAFIPALASGHTLLTTRIYATGSVARAIDVQKLAVDEAVLLLLRRAKLIDNDSRFEEIAGENLAQARAIALLMDNLPLALDQAGAYIEETGSELATYLDLYRTRRTQLLQRRGHYTSTHPEPVAATWSLSFEKLKQKNPAASELLQLCAFLQPDAIPEEMLTDGAAALGPVLQPVAANPLALNEAIADLLRYSLVRRDVHSRTIIIHRLVQDVIRDQMDVELYRQWLMRVLLTLYHAFPDGEFATWPRCQRYLPHVQNCASLIQQHALMLPEAARLLYRAARFLLKHSQLAEAEPLLLQALEISQQLQGPQHSDTLEILDELATVYYYQGKYAEAERLYQQALNAYRQQPTSNQLRIAKMLFDLAELYSSQNRYTLSETHYQQAMAIYEQYGEAEYPALAETLDSLGDLYTILGRYKEAEVLHRRALTILEQTFGGNHPDTARSLDNLSVLYQALGRYEEAAPFAQRALAIREHTLGPRHRLVATSLNNLAVIFRRQGRYAEAERLLKRTWIIREEVLGHEHPDTANAMSNLALVYKEQARYEEARTLLQRALTIHEQQLGPGHLRTATTINHLATIYHSQKEYEKARALYLRALTIYERQSKTDHPRFAFCLDGLALLHQEQGNYEEAETLFLRALAIYEQTLGSEHPDTRTTRENYARLLSISAGH